MKALTTDQIGTITTLVNDLTFAELAMHTEAGGEVKAVPTSEWLYWHGKAITAKAALQNLGLKVA